MYFYDSDCVVNRLMQITQLFISESTKILCMLNNQQIYNLSIQLYIKSQIQNQQLIMKKRSTSKYSYEKLSAVNTSHLRKQSFEQIKQQLRQALEELQNQRLSCDVQCQKRNMIEHQCTNLKEQNNFLKQQLEELKKEVNKMKKKYSQHKSCKNCQQLQQIIEQSHNQKQILQKQRHLMKIQTKELHRQLQQYSKQTQLNKIQKINQHLKREKEKDYQIIQRQKKDIEFMEEKIQELEIQSLQTLQIIKVLELKFDEQKANNSRLKRSNKKDQYTRKSGSIRTMQRLSNSGTGQYDSFIC